MVNEKETERIERISTTIAKAILSDIADNAEHHQKSVILTRYNRDVAAIVPIAELERNEKRERMK